MMSYDLAAALAEARKSGTLVEGHPPPASLAEAYALQDDANAAYGGRRVGYKVGATSAAIQERMGADGPFYGELKDGDRLENGGTLLLDATMRGIEAEFAFVMERPYPQGAEAMTADAVSRAVRSCHLALEVVGRRTAGDGLPIAPMAVADFALNIAYVLGPEVRDWSAADIDAATVRGYLDGEAAASGYGRDVLGGPLNVLAWLAATLAAKGRRLEAGDLIMTGTTLGLMPVMPGAEVRCIFGELGAMSLHMADRA